MKLVAALSGGVDSAVAAARAVEAGHDVTAVHLALTHGVDGSGCCTPDDARDARRVADVLGIPFYVWDLADTFATSVIDDFVASYAAGETPNPCVRCNERIKFAPVLDRARALGFDGLVTGHHARIEDGVLRRSVDAAKDQSYVLGTLRADQLAGAVFPVGTSTKEQVRAEATARGLLVADKPDSYDVCFAGQDTAGFLRNALGAQPGPIVDREGAVVGAHDGAYAFTVGQRRGVPLGGGTRDPRYVLSIEPASRTVVVGTRDELAVSSLICRDTTYLGPDRTCLVQLRAHAEPIACAVVVQGSELTITLPEPAYGIAPGQAAVLYDDDVVLGGAWISATNVGA